MRNVVSFSLPAFTFTAEVPSEYGCMELQLGLFDLACAKVAEAHKLMNDARELVKQDLDNLKEEKTAFEKLSRTLDEVHFESSVKLNVGGKIYKTTLDTLRKDPGSMLCAMFSGRHKLKPDGEDGAYFIDRDGKILRYIAVKCIPPPPPPYTHTHTHTHHPVS